MKTLRTTSKDGTGLSAHVSGSGPPLLLIHGAGNFAARWNPILPLLEDDFSIYALDRRGRGGSGDTAEYALEREFDDAASVIDTIGGPVHVLGHSLGGICALEAALRTRQVRSLILYEPPIRIDEPLTPQNIIDRLDTMLKADDREGVLTTVMLDVIRMPSGDVEFLRNLPTWKDRLALSPTLPRELRAINEYRFDATRIGQISAPTLLLLGEKSPPPFKASIQALASALPSNRTVVLAGQQHIAIDTAPDLFAREVLAFLGEHARRPT